MTDDALGQSGKARGEWFFLCAFAGASLLFWWLPSILFRIVLHSRDNVSDQTIAISIFALVLFVAGYLLPMSSRRHCGFSDSIIDGCSSFAFITALFIFVPALLMAIQIWHSRAGMIYGTSDPLPRSYQAVLYAHLFFGFMFIGAARPEHHGWRRIVIVSALVTLPRLIVSLRGNRFFLAQALLPVLLIAIARGWIRFSIKRIIQLAATALLIIFVPAITRGEQVFGSEDAVAFFAAGSSLQLFQDNMDLDLNGYCPPLLVSLSAKTIPYGQLGECLLDYGGLQNMPATLNRILTVNDPLSFGGTVSGTGSNYLLELFLFGGLPTLYIGSGILGLSCRRFLGWIGRRSLFAGIWAECLTRALFAPRSDLGYVFERIPSLLLATLAVVLIVWANNLLKRECSANIAQRAATQEFY